MALLAQKGGAGKTTCALHLAVIAQQRGLRTILVDCDPQRSASAWWKARESATPELVETTPDKLGQVIEAAAEDGAQLLVIDTRPSVERDTAEVARRSDFILIPTRPSILDLRAIGATTEVVKAAKKPAAVLLNSCPPGRGIFEGGITAEARKGLAAYGLPVVPVSITQRAALAHALIDGQAVTEFEPKGKAAQELTRLWKFTEDHLWPSAHR
nr:ParA family protein [Roseomonas haemaphysalidis]